MNERHELKRKPGGHDERRKQLAVTITTALQWQLNPVFARLPTFAGAAHIQSQSQ
jgi:hypothetical protein